MISIFLWFIVFLIIYYNFFNCNVENFVELSYLENLLKCGRNCLDNLTSKINEVLKKNPSISYNDFIKTFSNDTLEESILSKLTEITFKGIVAEFKISNNLISTQIKKYIPV